MSGPSPALDVVAVCNPAGMAMLSPRLRAIVDALPLRPDARVLEIGCGPGAAAVRIAARLGDGGHMAAIDRSAKAIEQAAVAGADHIASGRMSVRQVAAEDFTLQPGEQPYDLVFAVRVGALDGRYPTQRRQVLARIAAATSPDARLFIDGGDPLLEVTIPHRGGEASALDRSPTSSVAGWPLIRRS